MSKALSTGLISVGLSLAFAGAASALVIDTFTNGTGVLSTYTGTGTGSITAAQAPGGTNPLGGRRDGNVTKNNITGIPEQVQISVGSGEVSMSSDANTDASWSLIWGLVPGSVNADLSDGGTSNLFVVDVKNNASIGGSIAIDVYTGSGTLSKTVNLTASATPYTVSIPFSSFTGAGNWSNTNKVTMTVDTTTEGFDTVWSLVGTTSVPEPASLTLLGLAAMALLRRRAKN